MREILQAFLKTTSGLIFTLFFGVITSKIFAVNLGPNGVGLYSVLRQTRDTLLTLTTFNGNTAIVQGLASRDEGNRYQYSFIVSVIILGSTTIVVLLLMIFAPLIAEYTLHQSDPLSIWLIRGLSIPLIFSTGIMLFSSILNGYRAIGRLAIVQVTAAATTMLLAYPISLFIKDGNPIGFILIMSISTFVGSSTAYTFARRAGWLPSFHEVIIVMDKKIASENSKYFLSFAITTLITGFISTFTILTIRSMIVANQGLGAAGIFDVAWTLSMMYITIILSSFGTYYLPKLTHLKVRELRIQLINRILRLTMLLVVPIITTVIVLKPFVIEILYSSEFLLSLAVIRWMLVGDYLKTTSWVFGVTILAAADKSALFWSEVLSQLGFLLLSSIAIIYLDHLEGIGIAFNVLYVAYLAYTYYYVWRNYGYKPSRSLISKWIIGFLIIICASFYTWTDIRVNLSAVVLWISAALIFSWLSLASSERKLIYSYIRSKDKFF